MKPRQEHERCENCPAWRQSKNKPEVGQCREESAFLDFEDRIGTWPYVSVDDWCIRGIRLMREGEQGARDEKAVHNNLAYYT